MLDGHYWVKMTLLNSGKVLVLGGTTSGAELYDPATKTFSRTGSMSTARLQGAVVKLASGNVLVAGGLNGVGTAEIYDVAGGVFGTAINMNVARGDIDGVKLADGRVLIASGYGSGYQSSAELFVPGGVSVSMPGVDSVSPASGEAGTQVTVTGSNFGEQVVGVSAVTIGSVSAEIVSWSDTEIVVKVPAGLTAGEKSLIVAKAITGGILQSVAKPFTVTVPQPVFETGSFVPTGSVAVARYAYSATLLPDGKVLIAGGQTPSQGGVDSAELYDPATGVFTATGNMVVGRVYHTATLLPSGKVLLVGGGYNGEYESSAELYDPATRTFSQTGSLSMARLAHTATLLPDGKVLITGGYSPGNVATNSAELYDPVTGMFSSTGEMLAGRSSSGAILLPDGKVLVVGGVANNTPLNSADIYDPATREFSATSSMLDGHYWVKMTLLNSGKVLVLGGTTSGAELYDPATKTFSRTGFMSTARLQGAVVKLASGNVLVAGGLNGVGTAEIYDVAGGVFGTTINMSVARGDIDGVKLADGRVLIASGYGGVYHATAELFVPEGWTPPAPPPAPSHPTAEIGVLFTPDYTGVLPPVSSAEVAVNFTPQDGYPLAAQDEEGTLTITYQEVSGGGPLTVAKATEGSGTAELALSKAETVGLSKVGNLYDITPENAVFAPAAQVIFKYSESDLNGADEGTLNVYRYNTVSGAWEQLPVTERNTDENWIAVSVDHLCLFGMFLGGGAAVPNAEIAPSSGPIGLPFTITGSGFGNYVANNTKVLIGGTTAPLTLWNDTQIKGTVPGALAAGPHAVTVVRGTSTLADAGTFQVLAPQADAVLPSSGAIGVPFTINGTGFGNYVANYTRVLIGGTTAPLTLWTDTQIKGTVPGSLAAGDYELVVERELNGGTAATQPLAFKVLAPELYAIIPTSGSIGVGFTLMGANFGNYVANYTRVLIGGATAPLTLWADSQIKGTVPGSLVSGTYDVTVERELNGGLARSSAVQFTLVAPVVASVAPSSGAIGVPFTINGSSFGNYVAGYTKVLIGGTTAPLTLWSDTQIKGTVPGSLAAGDYELLVERELNGGTITTQPAAFKVLAPEIAAISPSSGAIGVPFTINGANFGNYVANYTRVLIGGTTAPLTLWTDTQIKGTVPGGIEAGEREVYVERALNGGLVRTSSAVFNVLGITASAITPSSGPIGVPFTITGSGFGNYVANYTRVLIGGATAPLTLWTDTQIKGTVPGALAPGEQEVYVERALNGGVTRSAALSFLTAQPYLAQVTPSTAAVLAPFTITGYNFGNYVANYTKVLIGGTTTALTLWTDTKIQGKLPFLPAGEYPVLVQRYLNGGLGESATAYISVVEPTLSSMTPVSGAVGTVFNIYGTGFGPYDASIAKVFMGGAQCSLSLWTDTQIRGTVPSALSYGTHTVTAVRGGAVSNGLNFVIPNYTPSMFRIGTAQEFRLGDVYVYPDPAKAGKAPVFHIEVGTADTVKLRVYTVAGQLAHERTLTGEPQSIGGGYAYEYAWDGRIASGVYYYTVEAERSGKKLKARGKFAVVR
jgi:WD40 repeat protein